MTTNRTKYYVNENPFEKPSTFRKHTFHNTLILLTLRFIPGVGDTKSSSSSRFKVVFSVFMYLDLNEVDLVPRILQETVSQTNTIDRFPNSTFI